MPEKYSEWYWEDLPEKARAAAKLLGYSKETWDEDGAIPYDDKGFSKCTIGEKHAAQFLGMSPLDDKFDVDWEELDEESKKAARALGYSQEKWDDDWAIQDLPCEELYWEDLSSDQQDAARFFGYSRHLWNEDDDDEDEVFEVSHPVAHHEAEHRVPEHQAAEHRVPEHQTAEHPVPVQHVTPSVGKQQDAQPAASGGGSPENYSVSAFFGGQGSSTFDHGNHPAIDEIIVRSDRHIVHGIEVHYSDGVTKKEGEEKGNVNNFRLDSGEYINSVRIRFRNHVQCLTFTTSKGTTHGPFGGEGYLLGKDREGEEVQVNAPANSKLSGFRGRGGDGLHALSFRWGPI